MCCATNRKVAGSIPDGVSGFFIDIKSFRSHDGPGIDSASNRNEYQEYFLGIKSGRRVRLTLPPSCAVVMKSGNLNFLEPSGPLRASNGTALPLRFNNNCNNKGKTRILIDGNVHAKGSRKGSRKETRIQEFMYRDAMNEVHGAYDHTGNNWSHLNVTKGLGKNLEAMPGKHSIDSLQKTAILGISHIIRKVLQCEA